MYYSISHTTAFRYSHFIRESVMELRMQPRSDGGQQCFSFAVRLDPKVALTAYTDYLGNTIHSFNIAGAHDRLTVIAEALVETHAPPTVPQTVSALAWDDLDSATSSADLYDMLLPSQFAAMSAPLQAFMSANELTRRADPLSTLWAINHAIYTHFDYVPNSTNVYSPIDDVLTTGKGVCQDYAHVMIAAARALGIPCRYVSGYLYTRYENGGRSARDATHAWVEAWIPGLAWIGFDPTNDIASSDRHIRVAVGRDYADVPPTRGIYKGKAETKLEVGVTVKPLDSLPMDEQQLPFPYAAVEQPREIKRADSPLSPAGISVTEQIAEQQQ